MHIFFVDKFWKNIKSAVVIIIVAVVVVVFVSDGVKVLILVSGFSLKEVEDQKEITIEPAQALDEVEPLPEDCYTRPISLPEGEAHQESSQLWVLRVLRVNPDFSRLPSFSHNTPPAPPAAWLPASGGVSASPQAQTPPDEALAAVQGKKKERKKSTSAQSFTINSYYCL